MGDIGDKSAIPAVELALQNEKTKDTSAIVLSKLKTPKGKELILVLLKSDKDSEKLDGLSKLDSTTSNLAGSGQKDCEKKITDILSEEEVRKALFYLTDDKNTDVRRKAFQLLYRLLAYIDMGRAKDEPHPLREILIEGLFIPTILKGINDPDEEIQLLMLTACFIAHGDGPDCIKRRFYTPEVSKAIKSKLESPNQGIRTWAAQVIKSQE